MSGWHLFHANNVKTEGHQPIVYILHRGVFRQVADHCVDGFLRFQVEGIIVKVVGFKVAFTDW
jgi:hypothetical protein